MSANMDNCEPIKPLELVEISQPKPSQPESTDYELKNLLPPDHPLLSKFQQSLKEHLLRVKNQLTEEIDELKHKIKIKEQEREEFGVKLYDRQNEIEKQNDILEEYSKNIHESVSKRIEDERQKELLQKEYDEKYNLTKQRKLQYNQRLLELGHLQNLENNIRKWTDDFETQLTSSKRVVSKDFQMQKAMAEEKQKSDLMFYNLQVEVKKREEELEGLSQQIADQTQLNNVLQTSLSDANADLEILQDEHKRLTQSWGEVIVAIQHRDKVLFQARQTLQKQQELLKLTSSSVEATKKQTAKERENNEKLEAFKSRLTRDLMTLQRDTDKQSKLLAKLEMKMEELPKILEQTEKDYQEAKQEGHQLNISLNALQFKLEKQYSIKSGMEESIFKIAQDQLMCDKASKFRLKVLSEHQEHRRSMEENLHKIETQLSNLLLQLERQKGAILLLHEEGDSLGAQLKELNDESDGIQSEIKTMENQIALKLKQIDKLSKVLDDLLKDSQGLEISPTEYKIKTLEISVQEAEQRVQDQQEGWLILQGHIVTLSQKRNNQLNEIQVARKQLMIIKQKSLKIDLEMENTENTGRELAREIRVFAKKLELLSAKGYEKKKQHETTESECEMEHFELLEKLKDSEMRVLQLEQETIDLSNDIEHHKNIVLERHREALSWETKYKLLDETLRWRRSESAVESEIGNMRAEIHRMEIRHKELKRAQEKLIQDLDHCVMHRERIFVVASTKQKMEGSHFRSRTNIQQKINDLRTKSKQVHSEIGMAEKKLNELSKEHDELEQSKMCMEKDIDVEIKQDRLINNEIEQGILLKHQNLESIVRKQNRAKEYKRLTGASSQPKISKSETSIELSMQKQVEINNHLTEVVEGLMTEFPDKKFVLTRLAQTLKD
ncbi:coiled-coil domain-containing protein 40 [Eupeodes corollae]|uniref:coiled-coil domain-containing protein 40 n=1 Tax=Eupeodes corollae TaxID=290404 RepID=UPI002491CEE8|nr:coiled-coil domain-containing protein 40 [Eupeodes corollae]